MTREEPKVSLTARLGVMETASVLEIDRKTLLAYTRDNKIKFGIRRGTNKKFFLGKDIINFWRSTL